METLSRGEYELRCCIVDLSPWARRDTVASGRLDLDDVLLCDALACSDDFRAVGIWKELRSIVGGAARSRGVSVHFISHNHVKSQKVLLVGHKSE